MSGLSYDRHRAELATQTGLLRSCVEGADMTVPVPTCPGWTLGQLLRHVGGTHHWAESVVRTRATGPVPEDLVNDVSADADADPEAVDAWVAEGAAGLGDALRAAGPAERVWTPGPGGTTAFWARRMLFEAVVHRADASWAVGAEFTVGDDVAVEGIDEWMGFGTVPEVIEPRPGVPPLLGPGRTLHFRGPGAAPGWLVDLTGDTVACHRADGPAPETTAVTVRAPLPDLLLLLYARRSAKPAPIEITGDARLLDLWVERSGFWLRE
ncbi:maleylpyruvate isomerase family mycothiol-dependent enzyme [Streptomyces sp. NPDC058665]|uniref:maleylpyruvate isomerase family mycothiol-dependent enzyme n=1 Tax=Streptomyces sp. NPDC058665 TaxID=3346586 RepID=UPI0036660975